LVERQGGVAFSTVSKVLQRLQDDLVISRGEGAIRLIQADTLMEKLAANYEPPVVTERFRGKCDVPREELCRRLATAAVAKGGKLVLTGAGSVEKYAATSRPANRWGHCGYRNIGCGPSAWRWQSSSQR